MGGKQMLKSHLKKGWTCCGYLEEFIVNNVLYM